MKIYLAGFKSLRRYITAPKPKYILESFVYLNQKMFEELACEGFLIDSGAFTFLSKDPGNINWKEYVEKYAAFIKKNRISLFFELDIYNIIGIKPTEALRDYLEQLTGGRCIPVWHKSLGLEYLHKISEEYSYIGLGGFAIKDIKPDQYKYIPQLLRICEKNDCKVHGLGFTNQEALQTCRFYSVDSLTWNGEMYGTIFHFRKNRLQYIRTPRRRSKPGVNAHNVREWVKFAQYAEDYL